MAGKIFKILELSVILIQFISTLVTAVYCCICISDISTIFQDRGYFNYISDIKNKFKFFLNISYTEHAIPKDITTISRILNGTCNELECRTNLVKNNYWKGGYLHINEEVETDRSFLNFKLIDVNSYCEEGSHQCFENKYYKTCVANGYICPYTGLISTNTDIYSNQFQNFYNLEQEEVDLLKTNYTDFLHKKNFTIVDKNFTHSLLSTKTGSGIPIVDLSIGIEQPCNYGYLIESNVFVQLLNKTLNVSYLNCTIFQDDNLPKDEQSDFDLKYIINKMNIKDTGNLSHINSDPVEYNSTIFDSRYLKIDQMDIQDYLPNIKFSENYTSFTYDKSVSDKKANIYIRKLFYAKDECAVDAFKIFYYTEIYNIAQIRVILLRYLNWNFIDIVFMIILNIYTRGFYIIKKLKKPDSIKSRRVEEDEKKFQEDTNIVVKLLHYFIIIIKIISALVAKYIYMDFSSIPQDVSFYDQCFTDEFTILTYKKINPNLLELYSCTSIISNINIYTLAYDFVVTIIILVDAYWINRIKSQILFSKID
jgi:hypothetical protein